MKKYKLLKDLPFAKAGEIFIRETVPDSDIDYIEISKRVKPDDYDETRFGLKINFFLNNFDEWFEEEPKIYFTIDFFRKEIAKVSEKEIMGYAIDNVKSLGLLFETKEEAEKYLEYLKAKAIIKQDTKGFIFDWQNHRKDKYYGYWNLDKNQPSYSLVYMSKKSSICFGNLDDIEESFKKHPDEWKTYLTYEQ